MSRGGVISAPLRIAFVFKKNIIQIHHLVIFTNWLSFLVLSNKK